MTVILVFLVWTITFWLGFGAMTRLLLKKGKGPKAAGRLIFLIGYGYDVAYNWIVGTVVFLEWPRELTFSSRVARHMRGTGWRRFLAYWIFRLLIQPFDPNHLDD